VDAAAPRRFGTRRLRLGVALLLGVAALAVGWFELRHGALARELYRRQATPEWLSAPRPGVPTRVLIVMDTVRSDHLSLCGYDRPTSPELEALVAAGAQFTCDAVAPGSWTVPSHASFFTGLTPDVHHAHAITSGVGDLAGTGARSRGLAAKHPTLATRLSRRGFQTAAVSGNPVVNKGLGLLRGFQATRVSADWADTFDDDLLAAFDELMNDELHPAVPLFLFVNIADAHQPWSAVPGGVGWLPPGERERYDKLGEGGEWRRYLAGTMPPEESAPFLQRQEDAYDWAIRRADHNVGEVVRRIQARGWCRDGCRFVITSDHGELLGDHGVLDHGHYVWQELVGVPLLVWNTQEPSHPLPSPVSAMEVYPLMLNGKREGYPATSMAWPHVRRCHMTGGKAFCDTSVATRDGDRKLIWSDGRVAHYDMNKDPREQSPAEVAADDPQRAEIERLAALVVADRQDDTLDPEVEALLKMAGYLD
jgi:Sulfatase